MHIFVVTIAKYDYKSFNMWIMFQRLDKPLCDLRLVYTSGFCMRFPHCIAIFHKLPRLSKTKVFYEKLQLSSVNACGNRMCKLSLTPDWPDLRVKSIDLSLYLNSFLQLFFCAYYGNITSFVNALTLDIKIVSGRVKEIHDFGWFPETNGFWSAIIPLRAKVHGEQSEQLSKVLPWFPIIDAVWLKTETKTDFFKSWYLHQALNGNLEWGDFMCQYILEIMWPILEKLLNLLGNHKKS